MTDLFCGIHLEDDLRRALKRPAPEAYDVAFAEYDDLVAETASRKASK